MKYSQKAQISLVKSVLLYGAKAFVLIYGLLLIFFSLSEITTALIKSRSFGVDFMIFVKPMLILLPTLLSVAVPYVFLITLFLVIRKLKQNNFFQFTSLHTMALRYLISAGLLISIFFGVIIYSLQENVLNKFDKYIEEEIRNIGSRPISTIIEPLSFNYLGDYVFYLPTIPDETKPNNRLWGNVYELKKRKVTFAGRGHLVTNQKGEIYLENLSGLKFDREGKLQRKINNKKIYVVKKETNKKVLSKYIAYYKNFFSRPDIPLSTSGHMLGYSYPHKLKQFLILQSAFFILSPVIIFLFILLSLNLISRFLEKKNYYFSLSIIFLWCLFYLIFPFLTHVKYNEKPSFFWFWMILFMGFIVILVIFSQNNFFIQSSKNSNEKEKKINFRNYQLLKLLKINLYSKAKLRLILYILKNFIFWTIIAFSGIFLFNMVSSIHIIWKLNPSMYNISSYLFIYLLKIPEKLLSVSPYVMVIIVVMILFNYFEKGIFQITEFFENISYKPIFWVFGFSIAFVFLSFFIRENYSYTWKKISNKLYLRYIKHYHFSILNDFKKYNYDFVRFQDNSILYYGNLINIKSEKELRNVIFDIGDSDGTIITAPKVGIRGDSLVFSKGYEFKLNRNRSNKMNKLKHIKRSFQRKLIYMNTNLNETIFSGGNIDTMPTYLLGKKILIESKLGKRSAKYLEKIFIQRLIPFILFPFILLFYCFAKRYNGVIRIIT